MACVITTELGSTKAIAEKYFGNEDPMGKVLVLNCEYLLTVIISAENPQKHFETNKKYDLFYVNNT